MAKTEFVFQLERPAKKTGGDRYKATGKIDDFTVYVPQQISRPFGKPVAQLTVTFDDNCEEL